MQSKENLQVLPAAVYHEITVNSESATERKNLLQVARYIFSKCIYSGSYLADFIPISSVHFREQVSTQYKRYLSKLESTGIVEVCHFYQVGTATEKGTCKEYRISPKLSFTEPFLYSDGNGRAKKESTLNGVYTADAVTRAAAKALKKLTLTVRKNKLEDIARETAAKQKINILVNSEVPAEKGYKYKLRYFSVESLKAIAKEQGKDLILYKDKIYIEQLHEFESRIRYQIQNAYLDSLVRLKAKDYFYNRNTTNYRLDTNLTNLKNDLLKYIRVEKEKLVSIDLSNSQITLLILAIENPKTSLEILNILENNLICLPEKLNNYFTEGINNGTPLISYLNRGTGKQTSKLEGYLSKQGFNKSFLFNVTKSFLESAVFQGLNTCSSGNYSEFSKSVKTGKFYESLQDRIYQNTGQIVTRAAAKTSVFSALFSSHRSKDKTKKLLAAAYPGVITWIDKYKRFAIAQLKEQGYNKETANDKGNAALAVLLQTLESAIFIDTILTRLQKSGFWVLSKHDSIICKESDAKQVFNIVAAELNEILGAGNYRLKCEYAGTNEPLNL